jgi:hypothetical protein
MTERCTVAVLPGAVKEEVFVDMGQLGLYAVAQTGVIVVDKEFSLDAGWRQD